MMVLATASHARCTRTTPRVGSRAVAGGLAAPFTVTASHDGAIDTLRVSVHDVGGD
ncbi:hypothetical protein ACIRD6_01320 [Streptomyces sp. NPDC102473]|uniref:hypothetical protein n=1 Tax=Streptomyces sp. NPDC102473 TaxID=3366180 RepID=UPI00382F1285